MAVALSSPDNNPPMITNVYVDTFNLYYGLLKGSPYRWLESVYKKLAFWQ